MAQSHHYEHPFCVFVQSLSHVRLFACMPGFPVLHHLLEFAQTHVHFVYFGPVSFHISYCHLLAFYSLLPDVNLKISWFESPT